MMMKRVVVIWGCDFDCCVFGLELFRAGAEE